MAKVIVIQHVPYEPLGTIVSLLREQRHRIKHINFVRTPDVSTTIEDYDALIVLGGPMNVDDTEQFPFLLQEINLIQQAIKTGMPILGICLGAQLIAKALGSKVYSATEKEVGWFELKKTDKCQDSICHFFEDNQRIFQWHEHTFDLPDSSHRLLASKICPNQAFLYRDNVYGFQFHLEITEHLIQRWFTTAESMRYLPGSDRQVAIEQIQNDTIQYIEKSKQLSLQVFNAFFELLPKVTRRHSFPSR